MIVHTQECKSGQSERDKRKQEAKDFEKVYPSNCAKVGLEGLQRSLNSRDLALAAKARLDK